MADSIRHVKVEEVDWLRLLPVLRLLRTFRMACHPGKLFLAMLLVVLVYTTGTVLDAVWSRPVYSGEITAYSELTTEAFDIWRSDQEDRLQTSIGATLLRLRARTDFSMAEASAFERTGPDRFTRLIATINDAFFTYRDSLIDDDVLEFVLEQIREDHRALLLEVSEYQPRGIFEAALRHEVEAFERLVAASLAFNVGGEGLLPGRPTDRQSVIGALRDMFIVLPMWFLTEQTLFAIIYGVVLLGLWSLLGGAISRVSAVQASTSHRASMVQAVRYAGRRFLWFFTAPLLPVLVMAVLAGGLWLFGFVFFGIPYVSSVISVFGGLLFALAIGLGLLLALTKIGLALAVNLLYPAVSVEGADAFDANSRAFSYVIGRPWHLLFYNFAALVYLAATYIFVGGVIFLALLATQFYVRAGAGVFSGGVPFDAVLPAPQLGHLIYKPDWAMLNGPEKLGAVLTMVWVYLFFGLSAAYAISYYFSANTWIYLLLRRSADGTDYDDVAADPMDAEPVVAPMPDKVEPAVGSSPSTDQP